METLHRTTRLLYTGRSHRAEWFRYALVVFDTATIVYFILSLSWPQTPLLTAVDAGIGLLILADLAARFWISEDRRAECLRLYTIADLLVVASLLLAPIFTDDLAFLRVLRALRLIHSYHLIRDLRRESRFFRLHEDTILAAVHLFVFIFVMASLVFVVAFGDAAGPGAYIDALYFTVSTLTTTGFGDITLTSPGGKLLTVVIMVVGGRPVPATGARHLPTLQGALQMPRMRAEPPRSRRDPLQALRRAAEDRDRRRQRNLIGHA